MPTSNPSVVEVVERFTKELEAAIRRDIDARVHDAFERMRTQVTTGQQRAPQSSSAAVVAGRRVRLCPIPGCSKPAAGPKYGWRCREHGADYRARAAAKSGKAASAPQSVEPRAPVVVALPAPKQATVIPPNIPIKRLPPAPQRGEKRAGPPSNCRLPGCLMKNSGPRYDFFCRDHYAALNKEERQKYAEIWRTQRAAAGTT